METKSFISILFFILFNNSQADIFEELMSVVYDIQLKVEGITEKVDKIDEIETKLEVCETVKNSTSFGGFKGECPKGWWINSSEGCFFFGDEEEIMSWKDAQKFCKNIGGYLAEIKTEQQQIYMVINIGLTSLTF